VNSVAWYLNIIPNAVKEELKDLQSTFTSLASYIGSFVTLSRYSQYHVGFRGFVRPELLRLEKHLHRLKLPTNVPSAIKEDLYIAKITEETHPGCVTRYIARQKNEIIRSEREYSII